MKNSNGSIQNVLVTGGCGFIGTHVINKLTHDGYSVTVLDNFSMQIHGKNFKTSEGYRHLNMKTRLIEGDVRDKDSCIHALKDEDAIIHLAAETGTGQSMYEISRYVDTNVSGTALMMDILINNSYSIKKIVLASSRAIYGEGKYLCDHCGVVYPSARDAADMEKGDFSVKCPQCGITASPVPTTEDSIIHPTSIYGVTKQVQEQIITLGCQAMGISAIALRYQNVYGPGQSLKNPYTGILSIFSQRILEGKDIDIFEDGREARDFVYVDDVANATVLALKKEMPFSGVFNIGTGSATSVKDVVDLLQTAYAKKLNGKVSGNYRTGDIRTNFADISNARKDLGFSPEVKFSEGIKRFSEWVVSQQNKKDKSASYEKSLDEMRERGLFIEKR